MVKLGATGEFPLGKLGSDDEGGLVFAVTSNEGLVHIDFGKAIEWIAMSPETALELAKALVNHARAVLEESNHVKEDAI